MKRRIPYFFLFIAVISLLSGMFFSCTSTKFSDDENELPSYNPVYITKNAKSYLMPLSWCNGEFDETDLFEGKLGSNVFSSTLLFKSTKKQINITMIGNFGNTIAELNYDGKEIFFESSYFPSQLETQYVIFDIQTALYDFEKCEQHFKGIGLSFEQDVVLKDDGLILEKRILKSKGQLVEEILIDGKQIKIKNSLKKYEYIITRL